MSATIIDGKAIAADLRRKIDGEVARLKAAHGITPGIAVVLVGEDPASSVYVRTKGKAMAEAEVGDERIPRRYADYLAGRALHFTIEEFSIFMGPKLFTWTRKGILYSIRLFPIGAFVRFAGEETRDAENPDPGLMYRRPRWAREWDGRCSCWDGARRGSPLAGVLRPRRPR